MAFAVGRRLLSAAYTSTLATRLLENVGLPAIGTLGQQKCDALFSNSTTETVLLALDSYRVFPTHGADRHTIQKGRSF